MNEQTIKETRTTLEEIASKILGEGSLIRLLRNILETPLHENTPDSLAMAMLLEQIEEDLDAIANQADGLELKLGKVLKAKPTEAAAS